MSTEVRQEKREGSPGRGRLGIVMYTPPSSSLFQLGIELAEAAIRKGYDVEAFAWGEAVHGTTVSSLASAPDASNAIARLGRLLSSRGRNGRFTLNLCTSCYKLRGLSQKDAIPGAHLGGLHNVVGMFQGCDRTLLLVP